ncbi:MAG: hypothetical protein CMB84_03330 [Flammeovirgaceae bacterium]|nr:hypothetical protein [Flammeovirgaceae bacterium]
MKQIILISLFLINASILKSNNSILKEGNWIKIGITESGVYKVDLDFFKTHNLYDVSIDPNKIQIFGSGYNGPIPQLNSKSNLFQPVEIETSFIGNDDNHLDEGEYLFFYLQSSDKLLYDSINNLMTSKKNIYTDTAYYLLSYNSLENKSIIDNDNITDYDSVSSHGNYFYHYENDRFSIIQSGREWFGKIFSSGESYNINLFEIQDESKIDLEISLVSRSTVESSFDLFFNDKSISLIDMDLIKEKIYGEKYKRKVENYSFNGTNNNNIITLKYNGLGSAISYLDYIKLNTIIPLTYEKDQIKFYVKPSPESKKIRYNISSSSDIKVLDVSDPYNIHEHEVKKVDELNYYFVSDNQRYQNKIVFQPNSLKYPIFNNIINNANVLDHNNPDLIIITSKEFVKQAMRIKDLRESKDLLNVKVEIVDDIYNQFSSGNLDVSSIRNYIKYIYNSSSYNLKYVLLFGDCSYDYKDRLPNNTNFVPIYQSYNSSNNIYSFSSDDYYGFLDSDEGIWVESLSGDHDLEVSIGRIPSKDENEARDYVDKLIRYSNNKNLLGDWKKNIYLVADDGDGNVHQNDAENHFDYLNEFAGEYDIKKIYLDNYEQKLKDGVIVSEEAKKELDNAIEDGSLILNYIGHGNEFLWTEEKILDENSIFSWNNRLKLPLIITATCEFGKFDDPLITSGGEMLLNKENGGAIALLTTTRPVFSQTNFRLNNQFYKNVFRKENGKYLRIGDIFKLTKNYSLSGSINRNFSLLGDPSLMLIYPSYSIEIDNLDTLSATSEVSIKGRILDELGNINESFDGNLYVNIFDKINLNQTLGDESQPFSFREWDQNIFYGLSSIKNGQFDFKFMVSKNIDYEYGDGKISLFAVDSISGNEASSFSNFVIGGTNKDYQSDNITPNLSVNIDDYNFISGDRVSRNPLLIVDIFDESGINIIDRNPYIIPHAILDDTIQIPLLNYFSQDKDSYKKGKIIYPLEDISLGKHKIEIKVSDNYNNISTREVVFIIDEKNKSIVTDLMNYPNPFSEKTTFKFSNQDYGDGLDIELYIFDIRGNLVQSIYHSYEISPKVIDGLTWDGKDLNGYTLSQGIYIYKLQVQNTSKNKTELVHNKLLKIR